MKDEVFDFMQINPHPVNIAFATYSVLKRVIGLSGGARKASSVTHKIAPSTALIRRFIGFKATNCKQIVKFATVCPDGTAGCPRSWDSVLGPRWDVLPAKEEQLDTSIRSLRFTEHRDFGMFTIQCHINTCPGRYRQENDYRSLIIYNMQEASKVDMYLA